MATAVLRGSVSEQIRQALLEAAAEGYEDAAIRGLCREGAWEAALSAIRSLDLDRFVEPARPEESGALPDSVSASAAAGLEAVALLERAASRCEREGPAQFRRRAGAIASRSAALRSGLAATVGASSDGWKLEAALDVATRCAQAATLAVEIHQGHREDPCRNAATALRLAAAAAECALDCTEAALLDLEDEDRVRSTRRRVWRSRLLVRRARMALRNSKPERDRSAGDLDGS